jgi:proteasome lid subunit RPN8/RPN11
MDLVISSELLVRMRDEARAAFPHECCGLLLGDEREGSVLAIAPARNVAAESTCRFEIDPAVLLRAHKAARGGGPQVIGHYHSHPSGDARPSETDAAMAAGEGEYWIILGHAGEILAWRAVRDEEGAMTFHPIMIES